MHIVFQTLTRPSGDLSRRERGLHHVFLFFRMTTREPLDRERFDVDRVRLSVEDLFRDQLTDAGGVLKPVTAKSVREDEARQLRHAS